LEVSQVLEPWAWPTFDGTAHLNRIQSAVYKCAYNSFENMLVCAPTGAGKTNIAMLTILQLVKSFVYPNGIDTKGFKIIYIAPMKALAQEVVAKFTKRLSPLGIVVREYTGDMQLSKQEVADAQILVCTPEKYDVSTRKGGDGSLITMVNLIIIDEIHLLADERGSVLETIVARTQRYVETSQKLVRIIGLSATLPNYTDVATFLRVNHTTGLFYFGSEYRPIPLDQTFLGVTEKNRIKKLDMMNKITYEKAMEALEKEKQIMIFVHSRRETSKTLDAILEWFAKYNTLHFLETPSNHEKFGLWKKQVDKSRSTELQNFFMKGVGIHHAGMLRGDRTLTEQLFEQGLIKILCCTSTLSWGVNLPAHTVIIKGTEMYDPSRGGFIDISILDVLQIFGRAGRPQYDNSGHAILLTSHASLNKYLGLFLSQVPIESCFIKALADHLNAEIVNGTVNNIKEAMNWLSYTFLFIRMKRNPLAYGMKPEELYDDPQLEKKRKQLIIDAAQILDSCMMIRYDAKSANLAITDLGRIASYYYLKYTTIEGFNSMLTPFLTELEAVHLLTSSSEFNQLKIRPEEISELDNLQKHCSIKIKTSADDPSGKVSILLQSYLNHAKVNSFTLQSDINYISQNASRITRALFEICLKRSWSTLSIYYLSLAKCIEYSLPLNATPLRQFQSRKDDNLPFDIIKKLEEKKVTVEKLLDLDVKEICQLISNQRYGGKIKELAKRLPKLNIDIKIQPISKGIIRLQLTILNDFEWSEVYHSQGELFHLFIEDNLNEYVYHYEQVLMTKAQKRDPKLLEIMIPVKDPLPSQYYLRVLSDKWINLMNLIPISFHSLFLPTLVSNVSTDLLNLHPIPISALQDPVYEAIYAKGFQYFNPIQSQIFHSLYYTNVNCLIGAPTGSGKTIIAELAIFRLLKLKGKGNTKIIYIAPLKALAKERLKDWNRKFKPLSLTILELTGESTPGLQELRAADILIVTPEKWDSISRGWSKRDYVKKVDLVIIDEIHLLGVERGPVLEVIVSRMRFIATQMNKTIRFVGLSTALANARDLADWLGIEEGSNKGARGLYNFKPSVRPVPITIHIQGFPGKHYCPRMATMNKPCYSSVLEYSPEKPVLIFVSSRRQTRLTALDLIAYCAADDNNPNPKKFLHMPEEEMEYLVTHKIKDKILKDLLLFGIGIHHAGLENSDRELVEELFLNNKIQVLVCTSTLACKR
jgi:activating signal cointegrator complex subunit 3